MFKPQLIRSMNVGVAVRAANLSCSPDGHYFLIGGDRQEEAPLDGGRIAETAIWPVRAGGATYRIAQKGSISGTVWSSDNRTVGAGFVKAVPSGGIGSEVHLWNATTQRSVARIDKHEIVLRALAFSPDGSHLIAAGRLAPSGNGSVKGREPSANIQIMRSRTGEIVRRLSHPEYVWAICVSPNRLWLASSAGRSGGEAWSDNTVVLWDFKSGKQKFRWLRPNAIAQSALAFSPDNALLATGDGDEGDVLLFDTRDGSMRTISKAHKGEVYGAAFAPKGDVLATWGRDGVIRMWSVPSGTLIEELKGHRTAVHAVTFSPRGGLLISGDVRHEVNIWRVAKT